MLNLVYIAISLAVGILCYFLITCQNKQVSDVIAYFAAFVAFMTLLITIMIEKEIRRIRSIENEIIIEGSNVSILYSPINFQEEISEIRLTIRNLGKKPARKFKLEVYIFDSNALEEDLRFKSIKIDKKNAFKQELFAAHEINSNSEIDIIGKINNNFKNYYLYIISSYIDYDNEKKINNLLYYCTSLRNNNSNSWQVGGMRKVTLEEQDKVLSYYLKFKERIQDSIRDTKNFAQSLFPLLADKFPSRTCQNHDMFEMNSLYSNSEIDGWFDRFGLSTNRSVFSITPMIQEDPTDFKPFVLPMNCPPFSPGNNDVIKLFGIVSSDNFNKANFVFSDSDNNTNNNKPVSWTVVADNRKLRREIVDVGFHLRAVMEQISVSDQKIIRPALWMYSFVTLNEICPSTHLDFEILRTKYSVNEYDGFVENNQGYTVGGHIPYNFAVDGTLIQVGDFIVSLDYRRRNEYSSSLKIWVSVKRLAFNVSNFEEFNLLTNRPFNFTGKFEMHPNGDGYGYAEITTRNSTPDCVYISHTETDEKFYKIDWNTLIDRKEKAKLYKQPKQLVTFGLNLEAIGQGFSTLLGSQDPKELFFGSLLFKNRSTEDFGSKLLDFSGPFEIGFVVEDSTKQSK